MATGTPVALATNGTVRLARGLASSTYTAPSLTANCTLMRPTTSSASAMARVWASMGADHGGGQGLGRQGARGVPRVHARLLDVLHDAGDEHLAGAVAHRVDVHLDGVLEEPVDEHRPLRRHAAFAVERPGQRAPRPRSSRSSS